MPSVARRFALALACLAMFAAASPASGAMAVPALPAAAAAEVPLASLMTTGARTDVTVRGLRRSAQARWIDHVIDVKLVSLDGCVADVGRSTVSRGTYRAHVNTVCAGGVAQARRAAAALERGRPWYDVAVRSVRVAAFTFEVTGVDGRGDPVDAALAKLPLHDFTYVEGDQTWMLYVGTGVTQSRLDAARAAFAAQLRVPVGSVEVKPLRLG